MSVIFDDAYLYPKVLYMLGVTNMARNFTFDDIENDERFQKFLFKKRGRAPKTMENYLLTLKNFCNFTDKTPSELHDIHREDLRNRVAEFDMWLTDELDSYISHMIKINHSFDTILGEIGRIKSFLHTFKLRPTPEIEIPKKRVLEDAKYALKVQDIRKAIKFVSPTYQVVFLTQAQTGLSISDVLLLDIEDFIFAVSKRGENLSIIEDLSLKEAIYRAKSENLIGCFDLRRKKSNNEFYTFAGPEVLRNMAILLESRNEYLERNAPIFIKETCRLSKEKKENLTLEDMRLTPKITKNYVIRMHKQRGIFPQIEVDGKKKNYFRTHKLRKWFSNQVRFKAGFSADDTKYLMGQKTGDVLEHYIDPNNYLSLKTNYRKALPFLAINDKIVMEENLEKIDKLTKENEQLITDSQAKEELLGQMKKEQEKTDAKVEKLEAMVLDMIEKQTK